MGPAVRACYSPHGEYMFGLLGYSTWNIYDGKKFIGQVTLNAVDRTAFFTAEAIDDSADEFQLRSWTWWMKWLRHNRQDPL